MKIGEFLPGLITNKLRNCVLMPVKYQILPERRIRITVKETLMPCIAYVIFICMDSTSSRVRTEFVEKDLLKFQNSKNKLWFVTNSFSLHYM